MNYQNIIDIAIEIIVLILAGYVLPKLRELIKAKLTAEEWAALEKLITELVKAAEQTLKDNDPTGKMRKQYVITQLKALEYDITEQVDAMIEAAVYGVNHEGI